MSAFFVCILSFLIMMGGCTTVAETAKGIAGVSTKILEEKRPGAIKKTFNCDYNTCYNKAKRILTNIGTYIYSQSKKRQMIAVYVSQEDTTAVGIFFKSIDANNTQVEISSASTYAKEFIAGKLFSGLEKSLNSQEEKGQADAKQETGNK